MGSRDVSRWVFKLTAEPICPPLIPEWYLSLLEFYIVSSVSKSVLALPQIVILLTSDYLALSSVSRRVTRKVIHSANSGVLWLSNMLMTPDGPSAWGSLPNTSHPSVSVWNEHHSYSARSVVPEWLHFMPGNSCVVKITRILMGLSYCSLLNFKRYFKEQTLKI